MNPRIRRTLLGTSAVVVAVAMSVQGASAAVPNPLQVSETEPATAAGQNDTIATAQPVSGFGTASWEKPGAVIHGTLSPALTAIPVGAEDNGSIPLATATGIGTGGLGGITTTGTLGDGPHGALGDRTNDFDFYKLTGTAGHTLTVSTEGSSASTDTVVGVYNAAGQLLASDDNGAGGLLSKLTFQLPANGDYFVVVAGQSPAGSFPADPKNSGSGFGGADQGDYKLLIASGPVDKDFFSVRLRKGDVLGGGLAAAGQRVTVYRADGSEAVGSTQNMSGLYPASSPLPRTASGTFAYVAENTGWYAVSVTDGFGPYDLTLEAYRPGTESAAVPQTFFLDFNGGQIDTTPLGGPGVRQLSGLSAFITKWGLSSTDESAVISKVVAVVTENVKSELVAKGLNPNVDVKIRNSRDDADTFGTKGVSRVVVGGTVAESGIFRTTAAQSIDPGNFAQEETALVQLDRLSGTGGASINQFMTANSNRAAFVGQALGNLVSREIGHVVGNFDTDPANATANLMDADGNYRQLFGVGPDGLGGTADDVDVDFGKDTYLPSQGFIGVQDTLNVAAWGLSGPSS
jgi:hypothetical protein